ncbi:UxaA family hydrolase [Rhodopirellula sp. MGV]|uniref:UxaA family hydrolase n=1 Tax=Rhodopirellula sp. MGV TaxID=2023130 RepID=UPI000B96BB0E|nr:altronate dehydratase family protein [Rhodopirellula sp. MGV]OYP34619.1 altronate hydrolase [Rhodopirellula sp. MGV]PNY37344.1 altronate dehydratase [Rhodopirellula baltica]
MAPHTPPNLILLHESDNVAIAVADLSAGTDVSLGSHHFRTQSIIPRGHKVSVCEIPVHTPVLKYGQPIGKSSTTIAAGSHVHSHNLVDHHDVTEKVTETSPPPAPTPLRRTFEGFVRPDGRVGTRNYVAVLSTVNCSATVCHKVVQRFDPDRMKRWPNVDGVFAATHTTGCALALGGRKHQMIATAVAGYAQHPNVGGRLIIGLGCEQNTTGYLAEHHGVVPLHAPDGTTLTRDQRVPVLTMQTEGGSAVTIDRAERLVEQLLDQANEVRRTTVDASHLMIGVECGGSDGYSGITANPAIGAVSDRVVACGGTSIISETTELYGAEHLLCDRSRSPEVGQKLVDLIRWWQDYVAFYGGRLDNNPSVGNKAGGLTTITEKSLGAVSKSGSTTLEAVYDYAERVNTPGLVVMDSPGFDPSSVTGKVAGGANLILFSTGRGSCFGCKPTPVIKIASNSELFENMRDDMDLNAGEAVAGKSIQELGDEFFEFALRVASGETTASERNGFGDHEFVPWTVGPVL